MPPVCCPILHCQLTGNITQAIKAYFGKERMWLVLGLTQGLKGLLSFLSAPLIGALSDKSGRKSFLLLTVGCTCLPLPFLFIPNLMWYAVVVGVSGAFAVTFSIVFAYVSDITTPEDRNAAFGQVSCVQLCSCAVARCAAVHCAVVILHALYHVDLYIL